MDDVTQALINQITDLRSQVQALQTLEGGGGSGGGGYQEPLTTGLATGEFVFAGGDIIMVEIIQ